MLWNDRFLFLHVPKTAGKSLTRALLAAWERPIGGVLAPGQLKELADLDPAGLHLETGSGHESMPRARRLLAARGRRIEDFEAILVVVRNPYDLMVSTYFWMRALHPWMPDEPKFRFAAERDLATFCARVPMTDVSSWMTVDGAVPQNLVAMRFERLAEAFGETGRALGFREAGLPRLNASRHADWRCYLTDAVEAAIHGKLPYLFDAGYYPRWTPAQEGGRRARRIASR